MLPDFYSRGRPLRHLASQLFHSIPFHRFISGNEADIQKPDDTNSRHEEDRKCTERTIKHRKHKTHSKTTKTENERTCTFTQLEATLRIVSYCID